VGPSGTIFTSRGHMFFRHFLQTRVCFGFESVVAVTMKAVLLTCIFTKNGDLSQITLKYRFPSYVSNIRALEQWQYVTVM
jgi:hypothetical protein